MSQSNKSEGTADGTVLSTLLHRLEARTSCRSKYLSLFADLGQRRMLKTARDDASQIRTCASRTSRAALPTSPRRETQVSHVAPTPGAPPAGLQRPLARPRPAEPRRALLATLVRGSLSPESPPRPASGRGTSAGYLFALPGEAPARPPGARCPAWTRRRGGLCSALSALT